MTINYGYAALADVKAVLGITDTSQDATLTALIDAASREIDGYCGRRFWQDDVVNVRYFDAYDRLSCEVDDISTTTGLIVAVDLQGTGAYDVTLTLNQDFILEPINAALEYPVRPYEELRIVPFAQNYFPRTPRPGVKVTAKFGWPAVPVDIARICLNHAAAASRNQAQEPAVVGETAGSYSVRYSEAVDGRDFTPDEQRMLARYAKPAVG